MFALAAQGAAPLVDPSSADGVFSLLWLVIGLPLLGAVILLVGGPLAKGRLDKNGHLIGAALPVHPEEAREHGASTNPLAMLGDDVDTRTRLLQLSTLLADPKLRKALEGIQPQ